MTAEQRLRRHIILETAKRYTELSIPAHIDESNVDEIWDSLGEECCDELQDIILETRESGEPTGLECEYSRHYESTAVARELCDDCWVGWTYWYGGGKHGNPEEVEWIEDAYYVDVKQETKIVNVFTKTENPVT